MNSLYGNVFSGWASFDARLLEVVKEMCLLPVVG